jgi:hypothetical protein
MKKYNPEQIKIYKDYLDYIRKLGYTGGRIPDHFPNKPSGFIEWLEDHPEHKVGFTIKKVEPTKCWNCGKKYPINYRKCPSCMKFNPDAHKNR